MSNQILIAYATMSGSTKEIAEFMAHKLANQGYGVEARACREVRSLDEYSSVVLGASIYMFHLHKDAVHFLQRYQKRLASMPLAVFAGGPYGPNVVEDAKEVRKNLDSELAKFAWLQPVSVLLVGGRFDAALLRFPYNLIPALKTAESRDARDWEEIGAWARELPGLILKTTAGVESSVLR
jgi:menaquinone-dependent protoporphyrinogen oxidase